MVLNGRNAIVEALKNKSEGVLFIDKQYANSNKKDYHYIRDLAEKNNSTIQFLSKEELKSKGAHQGLLFQINKLSKKTYVPSLKDWISQNQNKTKSSVIILDHILDPQNFGAIVRSAALFSIDLILLPKKRVAPENAFSARSAAGAMSIVPRCYENNLSQSIEMLKSSGYWVYGLDMGGEDISTIDLHNKCVFILGGEHTGVSQLLKTSSDMIVSIPNNNSLDSFNVSVSAAIACYEYYTQHINIKKIQK